ncbi:MAG: hypothetical protein SGI71_11690 [Verrucomicrobiota bacterium]|nr:hypothetical protein [Verrucomicrobiota bacterium]
MIASFAASKTAWKAYPYAVLNHSPSFQPEFKAVTTIVKKGQVSLGGDCPEF